MKYKSRYSCLVKNTGFFISPLSYSHAITLRVLLSKANMFDLFRFDALNEK